MAANGSGSLLEAMLAVQAAAPTLEKDRTVKVKTKTGGEYTYSYTPLDTIVEKVGPLLVANKLVWSTRPGYNTDYGPSLRYKLAHAPTGEAEEGEMPLMLAEQDAQGMGSAITYMRRYALCAVLNLVADADDDGALATGNRSSGGSEPLWKSQPASDGQKKFLKSLITQNKLDAEVMTALLKGAGVELQEGEKVNDAVGRLSKGQCSALIDEIQQGAVKEPGASDLDNDASGFKHPEPSDEDRRLLEGSAAS